MVPKLSPPFTVDELPTCFKVMDGQGVPVAYCYFRGEGVNLAAGEWMTKDQARAMAHQITRLPELLAKG